jgi:hypothetical protein
LIEVVIVHKISQLGRNIANILGFHFFAHERKIVFCAVHEQRVSHFDDAVSIDVNLLSGQGFMRKLINVQGVEGMTATIENAPHFVLSEVFVGSDCRSFLDILLDSLEGQLRDDLEFEGGGAHDLVDYFAVLNKVQQVGILNFLPLLQ